MPLIADSDYKPPVYLIGGHLQTAIPNLFRRVRGVSYRRERIDTPDGDFLDLDWSEVGSRRLVVIGHGLEGNSTRPYMLGMVRALNRRGWDALAWNFRGCSGEVNRRPRLYHSGSSDDLETVVARVLYGEKYERIGLVGFSLGGNIALKYLGERGGSVPEEVCGVATCSVPCDLRDGAERMRGCENRLYMRRFLGQLRRKVECKARQFPGLVDLEGYEKIRDFRGFDDRYTAPLHGFRDAEDYWERCSSKKFLHRIQVPALMINARNDPFLGPGCYPRAEARASDHFFLEIPAQGGHVGFSRRGAENWVEERVCAFLGEWLVG